MARKKKISTAKKAFVRNPKISARTPKTGKTSARYRRTGGLMEVSNESGLEQLADGTYMGTGRTKPISEEEKNRRNFAAAEKAKRDKEVGADVTAARAVELSDQVSSLGKEEPAPRKKTRPRRMPRAAGTGEGKTARRVRPSRNRGRGSIAAPEATTRTGEGTGVSAAAAAAAGVRVPARSERTKSDRKRTQKRAQDRIPRIKTGVGVGTAPNTSTIRKATRRLKKQDQRSEKTFTTTRKSKKTGKTVKVNKKKTTLPKRITGGAAAAARAARSKEAKLNKQLVSETPKQSAQDWLGTDEQTAHSLRLTIPEFKHLSAEDIIGFATDKEHGGLGSTVQAFHNHAIEAHNARTPGYKGGGRLVRWKKEEQPVVDASGKPRLNNAGQPVTKTAWVSSGGRGTLIKPKRKKYRDELGRNRKTAPISRDLPKEEDFPLSHLDYLADKINTYKDNKAAAATAENAGRAESRSRGVSALTDSLVKAVSGEQKAEEKAPVVRNVGAEKEAEVVDGTTTKLTVKDGIPPKGSGGRVRVKKKGEPAKVLPRPKKYREVRPKKRNSPY